DVLLIFGPIRRPVARHLVILVARAIRRVTLLADVLLVLRVVRRPGNRHLVLLIMRPIDRVAVLADVLFVDRLHRAVFLHDVELLADRPAHGVALFAHMILADGVINRLAAFAHHGLIHGPIRGAANVFPDALVARRVTDRGAFKVAAWKAPRSAIR